jgi:hypothetical protein
VQYATVQFCTVGPSAPRSRAINVCLYECLHANTRTHLPKRGSGKTTLAIHLAAEAAAHGVRTLLLDLDPQASAAHWANRRKAVAIDVDVTVESLPGLMLRCDRPRWKVTNWWCWTQPRTPTRVPCVSLGSLTGC